MNTLPKIIGTLCGCLGGLLAATLAAPLPAGSGDRPCKVIETEQTNYPTRMSMLGVKQGSALLILQIDETGRLADVLVTAYTHKPFADEALRVVRAWRFEPGLSGGEPITTIMHLTFNFELNGIIVRDVWGGESTSWGGDQPAGYEFTAQGAGKLDRLPAPVKLVQPTYPQEWADQGITGSVTVEFYIDDTGKVRMPYSPASTNEKLVGVALAAVRQWEFTPPIAKGKPVLTQVRQVLEFKKKEPVQLADGKAG